MTMVVTMTIVAIFYSNVKEKLQNDGIINFEVQKYRRIAMRLLF